MKFIEIGPREVEASLKTRSLGIMWKGNRLPASAKSAPFIDGMDRR
jgi:hypothetical protein